MSKSNKTVNFTVALTVTLFSALLPTPARGLTTLALPDIPLFVNISTIPNIFIEMDDSGSMDWDILAIPHFTACRYDKNLGCSRIDQAGKIYDWTGHWYNNGNRIFKEFEYVLSSDDDAYTTGCYSGRETFELCTNRSADSFDWRARSSALNVMFYDPATDYDPWPGYSSGNFFVARSYPDDALSGYSDTRNLSGFVYHYWLDDKGFSGSRPDRTDVTWSPNGIVDQWDTHVKVTVSSSSYTCKLVDYEPDSSGLNRSYTTLSATDSRCIAATGGVQSLNELQGNIANWYQFYRRRTLVARAGVAQVLTNLPAFRYGFSMINDSSLFVEMPAEDVTDFVPHNSGLIASFLEYQQQVAGTPLRRGLETVGDYFAGDLGERESPIVESCQKNFSLLFTDGFWNGSNPTGVTWDIDGDGGVVFDGDEDETDVLLADVAKYYYQTDLSELPDLVPTDASDPANHQHLVTYTIGFGIEGTLSDLDDDGWPDDFNPETHSGAWYLSGASDDEKRVDDLWHAAWNSRGKYISAKRPQELIDRLGAAILDISERIGGAASGSSNGGSIATNSKIFQAKFDALDWHGELLAINIDATTGMPGTVAWEAGAKLDAKPNSWFTSQAAGRKIYTFDRQTWSGSAFSWSSINSAQQAALHTDPVSGSDDGEGQARLNYIRGSKTDEGDGNFYRIRNHRLGDLGHSDPEFVGRPPFFYPFGNYQNFANLNKDRRTMLYVGGNDGMLHGFDENTGEEVFAFVPDKLIGKLNRLTDTGYNHTFYVDGSPIYGDAQVNGSWKSVLAGSLRGGGQGVYALDITDPDSTSSANVLWEFTDADDADLGYVFGEPQIRRMANGKWAVIVSSGYNNTEADGFASATGKAYLFVLFIESGLNGWSSSSYAKIEISGADGLAAPAVADVDGDAIADFIYVGDLDGNLWKVDVTSTNTLEWGVAFNGSPLFVAEDHYGTRQPITIRPSVMRHPLSIQNGVLLLFGTGKYLETSDDQTSGIPTQSVYAIWDRDGYFNRSLDARNNFGAHDFNRATDLVNPVISTDSASGSRIINDTGTTAPTWFDTEYEPLHRGWVVDLPEAGERMVRQIVLRDKTAFMVSLIPADDVCAAGGSGWLMALNAETGAAPRFPVLDLTDDGVVNIGDIIELDDPGDPEGEPLLSNPVGREMLSIPNLPAFLYDDRPSDLGSVFPPQANAPRGCGSSGAKAFTYTTKTNGSVQMIVAAHQPLSCGRQSWVQTH